MMQDLTKRSLCHERLGSAGELVDDDSEGEVAFRPGSLPPLNGSTREADDCTKGRPPGLSAL
jgi:hypothetical protein